MTGSLKLRDHPGEVKAATRLHSRARAALLSRRRRAEALNFCGSALIGRKEQWPRWTPTAHMMAAMPRYRPYAGGMDGGPDNPLGARALYLYRDGRDTYFRLHGTNEPESIGHAVSSGCIRLFNPDIMISTTASR